MTRYTSRNSSKPIITIPAGISLRAKKITRNGIRKHRITAIFLPLLFFLVRVCCGT